MTNYVKSTNFTVKDSLPTGDTNKVIRGAEFDTEFDAIATAVATKSNNTSPTFTGTATFDGLTATGTVNLSGLSVTFSQLDAGAVTLSSETFSDVDNQIPTNAAVIDYVAGAIPGIAEVNDLTAVVTWADVPDANITQSSVTQHQAALSIAASQLSDVTATATELNYVDGVTSNIQTQIDNINPSPIHTATASGTLANGDTVIVNSDGTVSAISGVTQSAGSDQTYVNNGSRPGSTSVTYDTNENKVVVVYKDAGNSNYGTAIVGSVSGSTITFGTAVAFTSVGIGATTSAVFDSSNNKVVISYLNNTTGYGESIVGTVSGTSISFGTAVVWNSGPTYSALSVFDSTNNKVVVYSPMTAGIRPHAVVGTVSGTSISFGSIVQVDASVTTDSMSIGFDSNAGAAVVTYRDGSATECRVGTVSGTSISFGSAAVLISGNYAPWVVPIFDSSNNKMVLFYDNQAQSRTEVKVGTVSGTNITLGSAVETGFDSLGSSGYATGVFDSFRNKVILAYTLQNPIGRYIVSGTVDGTSVTLDASLSIGGYTTFLFSASVFDPDNNKTIICYVDNNTNTGEAFAFTTGFTTLTSENYIGISNAAYSDAATATIQIVGSIDDAQSGLTAGQAYYIQNDGSLGTSAGAPSVFAGTAVSATELIVKG
jgi:hypothetical protein